MAEQSKKDEKPARRPYRMKPGVIRGHGGGPDHPNKFKPEYIVQVKKLCALGAVDIEIADFFNVTVPTIYNWRHAHPKFEEACRVGKKACDARVERGLYHRAAGFYFDEEKVYCFWDANKKTKNSKDKVVEHRTTVRKYVIPDSSTAERWLKIRDPERWNDRSAQEALEAGRTDPRPAIEELLRFFYRQYDTQERPAQALIAANSGSSS
jgi:hypothetical protein